MGLRNLFCKLNRSRSNTTTDEHDVNNYNNTMTDKQKMTMVLDAKDGFPEPLRIVIDAAAAAHKKPKVFLAHIQNEFVNWLLIIHDNDTGLDEDRDTFQQVELALRFFPKVLSSRKHHGLFPLLWLTRSHKSVSFVPLFAKLGAELGNFHANERGGMVFGRESVFSQLAASTTTTTATTTTTIHRNTNNNSNTDESNGHAGDDTSKKQQQHQQEEEEQDDLVTDCKFLNVIRELRACNLMTESDVLEYNMIETLCKQQSSFPKQRFLYLIDWNPKALLSNYNTTAASTTITTSTTSGSNNNNNNNNNNISPRLVSFFLKETTTTTTSGSQTTTTTTTTTTNGLDGAKTLFGLAMKYYPNELGFLFDTTYVVDGEKKPSSFRQLHGKKKTMKKLVSKRKLVVVAGAEDEDAAAAAAATVEDEPTTNETKEDTNNSNNNNCCFVTSLFEFACDAYGREKVHSIVDGLVHQQMQKDANFTKKAVIRAATRNREESAETIFLMMQTDPSLLFVLLQQQQQQQSNKNKNASVVVAAPSTLATDPRAMVRA